MLEYYPRYEPLPMSEKVIIQRKWCEVTQSIMMITCMSSPASEKITLKMTDILRWIVVSSTKVLGESGLFNASVKGNLELPLLKGRRRFDVETTSNLEVYIFRGW